MLQPLAKGGCRESIGERSKIKKSSAQEKEPGSRRLQETPSSAEELLVWAFDLDFKLDVLLFNLAGGLSHRKLREGNWRTPCLELAIAANEVATSRKQHERGKSLATPHPGTRDALESEGALPPRELTYYTTNGQTSSTPPVEECRGNSVRGTLQILLPHKIGQAKYFGSQVWELLLHIFPPRPTEAEHSTDMLQVSPSLQTVKPEMTNG
ncbi:uncharacterized protein LOC120400293 isoform X2 [Mauremys reevesii]|uniref:uncharacterized protein LOC120400293 isoform X2 n=1 Tax=Mauremys reevesii TaxID=260615 RepID=UPI001940203F|nr:uncharacterized protein LOC120400293 isoform X2 [Mauremys reevesii]